MPQNTYTANALYYFDSNEIQSKALLIEDLEWITQMLQTWQCFNVKAD